MMARLMSDSVLLWARHYKIDSFRFDLMGHQPRSAMVRMQKRLHSALGRRIDFIGEGYEAAINLDWRTRLHPEDRGALTRAALGSVAFELVHQ